MLGNPELERALLEQTYDGVMTVTGTSKQEVGGETVVTPDAVAREYPVCAVVFRHTGQQTDANSGQISYQATIYCAPELTIPGGLPHCGSAVRRDLSAEIQRRERGLFDPSAAFCPPRGASVMASWGL